MEKVRFGSTGLMVSKVAFGGIPIERLSVSDAVDVIRGAIDLGVNFIDTANGYTDSEEKIGLAIKTVPRESLVIASKSYARDKKTFLEHLDLSLKRLGTDYLDIYQHHSISNQESYNAIMEEGGAFEGMLEAVRAGKVRFPAFTSHNVAIAIKIMREGQFYSVQLPFNFIDNEAEAEAIPLSKELDMGFIAMKPFGGGLLDDAGLVMRFFSQYDSIVPDPGIEKLEEIEEIVRVMDTGEKFTAKDAEVIEKMKAEVGNGWCHRCDYCQPCPQGIAISAVLSIESQIKRMTLPRIIAMSEKAMSAAHECTSCRQCVKKCPYDLDVPNLLKEKLAVWDNLNSLHYK